MRTVAMLASLLGSVAAATPATGLTMSVYNNSAWYGAPLSTKVVSSFDQSLPLEAGVMAMSVEITGSLTYVPTKPCFLNDFGCYTFNCSFGAASYGFLWFDDHLVCQHGAYVLHPDSFDGSAGNPLRVLSKKTIAVRLQAYLDPANPALSAMDARRAAIESNELEVRSRQVAAAASACNSSWHEGDTWNGHDRKAQVTQTCDECAALCAADPSCAAVVWNAPGGQYGDKNCNMKNAVPPKPWKTNQKGEMGLVLRPNHPNGPAPAPLPTSLDFSVQWMEGFGTDGPITPPVFAPIEPRLLSTTLAPAEQTRVTLQQNLTNGWGTWANSVLDLVLMPEGARITVGLCQISSGKCITSTRPSDTDTMRVAEHAYDKSFVRMFLTFQQANVSVEFSSGTGDQASDLELALTPLNCDDSSGGRDLSVVGGVALTGPTVNWYFTVFSSFFTVFHCVLLHLSLMFTVFY